MKIARLSLYSLLIVLPFSNLSRLPLGSLAITLNDFLLPVVIGGWLLYALLVKKTVLLPPRFFLIAAFISWAAITLILGLRYLEMDQFWVAALYWFRWVEYVLLFVVSYNIIVWEHTVQAQPIAVTSFERNVLKLLFFGHVLFVLFGFLQFVFFPNFSRFVQHGWDPHYYRLLSTFLDPNFAGIFIILGTTLFGSILLLWKDAPIARLKIVGLVIISSVAIVLTFSRSTYLGLIVAVGMFGLLKTRTLLVVFTVFALVIFLTIPRVQTRVLGAVNVDATAKARLRVYDQTFAIIEDNLLFGVGFNAFRYAQDERGFFRNDRGINHSGGHAGAGSDSALLFVWATTGIVGLCIYLALGITVLKDALSLYWRQKLPLNTKAYSLAISVGLPALFVHSQFVNSLFYIWIMEWFWIVLGLMYGTYAMAKKR